jgi:cellobiose-specific phosphotransferase system component IIA
LFIFLAQISHCWNAKKKYYKATDHFQSPQTNAAKRMVHCSEHALHIHALQFGKQIKDREH